MKSKYGNRRVKVEQDGVRTVIGIDPGTNTGYAVWNVQRGAFDEVECMKVHKVLTELYELWNNNPTSEYLIRIENPNTWKPFGGKRNNAILQGAGSIKRDYAILTDALTDWGIPFEGVSLHAAPKKLTAEAFRKLTGWQERTNQHGRDAAMLCYKYKV